VLLCANTKRNKQNKTQQNDTQRIAKKCGEDCMNHRLNTLLGQTFNITVTVKTMSCQYDCDIYPFV